MGLFSNLAPHLFLVVQAGAAMDATCAPRDPCGSIQAAVERAAPGTAILVRRGVYEEAVKFPSRKGGTAQEPIWLISADGPGEARIVVKPSDKAGIRGLGVQNVAVVGFEINGKPENGIQFGMSGDPKADPRAWEVEGATVARILIQGNRIEGTSGGDGIKISQANDVEILDNVGLDTADQCIDLVATHRAWIRRNDCSGSRKAASIFAKAGSWDIEIAYNHVHDVPGKGVAGISLGGWSVRGYAWPGEDDQELTGVRVLGNKVERTNGFPLQVLGARQAEIVDNYLDAADSGSPAVVGLSHGMSGDKKTWPRHVRFSGNVLLGKKALFLFDKSREADGQPFIDASRDAIVVQSASATKSGGQAVGPQNYEIWRGQAEYPINPR